MATFPAKTTENDKKFQLILWANVLLAAGVGAVAAVGQYPDKTLQITGTLGGGVPSFEGSMDAQTWVQLTTDGVNPIVTLGLHYVWENPNFVRPLNVGGDGTTDITYQLGMSTLV